jgi:hypothetical protein
MHPSGRTFVLAEYFDYVTGTDAVIAACIAPGMRVDEIRATFVESAELMFDKTSLLDLLRDGIVNLPKVRRQAVRSKEWSESSRWILGDFGEFSPCSEAGCELFAIE